MATVDEACTPLLQVQDLQVDLRVAGQRVPAVHRVSFSVARGEILGLVGESGAGKSLTGAALLGLLPAGAHQSGGHISLNGRGLDGLVPSAWQAVRGRQIGAIFQDPMGALNPLYTVGQQLVQTLRAHARLDRIAARAQAMALLQEVGLPDPERQMRQYPHELSGGMRQRVVIALALAPQPRLIVADEPTTALDVSVQAQVLRVFKRRAREHGTAMVLVTHDMGVVAALCDRVAVMYAGRLVETGEVEAVLQAPAHPYTRGLMAANPSAHERVERLVQLDGFMPVPGQLPGGCAFHPRCERAQGRCAAEQPTAAAIGPRASVACWFPVGQATPSQELRR